VNGPNYTITLFLEPEFNHKEYYNVCFLQCTEFNASGKNLGGLLLLKLKFVRIIKAIIKV
jgi:hypothetical protein